MAKKSAAGKSNIKSKLRAHPRPWALVTGASSGIGREIAKALSEAGYGLILVARRKDRLLALQEELLTPSEIVVLDLQQKNKIDEFFKTHKDSLKRVELIVNNAGLAKGIEKVQEGKTADWDTMIETNIQGLFRMTRGILPYFLKNKKGHVVNIGSVSGRWVYGGGTVYCATKFAVRAFSEGLRMDLMGTGIRVTNIEPGMVETEFTTVRLGDAKKSKDYYRGMRPLRPEDIAESVLWAVDQPAHVNIQELVIFPTDQAAVGPGYTFKKVSGKK